MDLEDGVDHLVALAQQMLDALSTGVGRGQYCSGPLVTLRRMIVGEVQEPLSS
ncbi:MAG TPA: hypothetical protein VLE23_17620 [Geminicoccaceae bacterium]|nr:hypothetical protein [Geminicoccaceae bacterium]